VRKLLLAGSAVLLLSVGAAAQQAPIAEPIVHASSGLEVHAAVPTARLEGQSFAPLATVDREATVRAQEPVESWSKNIASALRTAVLIGLGCFVVGLSAVGVTALWITDRTEESARGFEPVGRFRS
jgi:hypothetical protein